MADGVANWRGDAIQLDVNICAHALQGGSPRQSVDSTFWMLQDLTGLLQSHAGEWARNCSFIAGHSLLLPISHDTPPKFIALLHSRRLLSTDMAVAQM